MNPFTLRRDKTSSQKHARSKSSEPGFKSRSRSLGLLKFLKPRDSKMQAKVQVMRQRLYERRINSLDDTQIEYALQSNYSNGNEDRAYELLLILKDSLDGVIRPYNPNLQMLGAENRGNVTCWLDSLLFSMFARLGSFEPILYRDFDDEPRRQLSILLRLWVNMLRSGKLIHTDLTEHLQEALKACGWKEAADMCQNDTSEAFSFITETLQLPLLTMEMDIFHEGGGSEHDHKFINERLLEVAIPSPVEGRTVTLEDCLEEHFNVRVDVVRRLDRRETLSSLSSWVPSIDEKRGMIKVEVTQVENSTTPSPISPIRPDIISSPASRERASSIIRRYVVGDDVAGPATGIPATASPRPPLSKKGSVIKEVVMPAWQFFRIIPWYTANLPTNDAQVAAHFSSTRPVLGICLKRYAMSADGEAIRQNTAVDIPLQIALPHFVQDDHATTDGPLFGDFKLVLQSMVCHRGTSVHSGHYISIIRGSPIRAKRDSQPPSEGDSNEKPPEYSENRWVKLDDLAPERVTYVDIEQVLADEMPYLLFYQVQPLVGEDPQLAGKPPPYNASEIAVELDATTSAGLASKTTGMDYFSGVNTDKQKETRISFSDDFQRPSKSLDLTDSMRRYSLAYTDTSRGSIYALSSTDDTAIGEAPRTGRFSRLSLSRKNKSRPTSRGDEGRKSSTFSRLNLIRGKETLTMPLDITDGGNIAISSPVVSIDDNTGIVTTSTEVMPIPEPSVGDKAELITEDGTAQPGKVVKSGKKSEAQWTNSRNTNKDRFKGGVERECSMM